MFADGFKSNYLSARRPKCTCQTLWDHPRGYSTLPLLRLWPYVRGKLYLSSSRSSRKARISELVLNGSGVRDTARVLKISRNTVSSNLKEK
ncbi:IS1-like element transposase [Siphonobacter sp. SORGH_AS_1065]|uniref:IS1-like element transposase n=1 Tax=Siphonobacter sp. SORGH_AS_1065 TaxID=3041795 RepID=UPI00358E5BF6